MIGVGIGALAGGFAAGSQIRNGLMGGAPAGRGLGGFGGGQLQASLQPSSAPVSGAEPGGSGPVPSGFGGLSAKYESKGRSGAIAWDRTGGWSYGKYQFVGGGTTADGSSMRSFMATLQKTDPDAYQQLEKAGGFAGARSGSKAFRQAWRDASERPGFQQAEAENARSTLFDPAAAMVKKRTGLDVSQRSPALQEVLFSTAIQHGGAGSGQLWANAFRGVDPNTLSDREIIDRLYDERSNVGTYFRSSDAKVQQSVADRFKRERADALRMLGEDGNASQRAAPAAEKGMPAFSNTNRAPIWGLIQQLVTTGEA